MKEKLFDANSADSVFKELSLSETKKLVRDVIRQTNANAYGIYASGKHYDKAVKDGRHCALTVISRKKKSRANSSVEKAERGIGSRELMIKLCEGVMAPDFLAATIVSGQEVPNQDLQAAIQAFRLTKEARAFQNYREGIREMVTYFVGLVLQADKTLK